MAIPLTGPISLGDLKNDTAAPTASFDEPMIRRRWVSSDGLRYGDQLPANTQMSLGDFRGSIVTMERDFAGRQNQVGTTARVGLQTHQLVRDDAGVYGGSGITVNGLNPQYRQLDVGASGNYVRDVAAGMVSCAYVSPSLLPASANVTAYQISNRDTQRTIFAVNCWASGYLAGTAVQPIWRDNLVGGTTHDINFTIPSGYPYVTVFFIQVARQSVGFEACRIVNDQQEANYQMMKVLDLKLI